MSTPGDRNPYSPPSGAPAQDAPAWGQPPAGYGQPQQGYGAAPWGGQGTGRPPETEPKAIVSLVLAIASFVVFPLVPAIIALFVSRAAVRAIDAEPMRLTGRGLATAARVTAWVNIGLSVLVLVVLVVAFGFLVSVGGESVIVDSGEFSTEIPSGS